MRQVRDMAVAVHLVREMTVAVHLVQEMTVAVQWNIEWLSAATKRQSHLQRLARNHRKSAVPLERQQLAAEPTRGVPNLRICTSLSAFLKNLIGIMRFDVVASPLALIFALVLTVYLWIFFPESLGVVIRNEAACPGIWILRTLALLRLATLAVLFVACLREYQVAFSLLQASILLFILHDVRRIRLLEIRS